MIITIGFMCIVGWVIGAWLPWWVIAAMWCGYGINLCLSKEVGVNQLLGNFLWGILLITITLSGFILGDVTFTMIWDWLVMVFTGGKL